MEEIKMYTDTKKYLKELAIVIREYKNKRKLQYRGNLDLFDIESKIQKDKYEFRSHHIAYCELRGRKREEIETPSESNPVNELYIEKIKKEILAKYEQEIIHNC